MRAVAASVLRRALVEGAAPARSGGLRRRILDVGAGGGANARWLERWGAVTAVDVSPRALAACRRRGVERCVRASLAALPFAEGAFEIVTSFEVLHERAAGDERAAAVELARVLAPGGLLLVRVPASRFLRSGDDTGPRRYRTDEVEAMLSGAGLEVRYAGYVNALLWPFEASWRLPMLADRVFGALLEAEARVVPQRRLPAGASVLALAERPRA